MADKEIISPWILVGGMLVIGVGVLAYLHRKELENFIFHSGVLGWDPFKEILGVCPKGCVPFQTDIGTECAKKVGNQWDECGHALQQEKEAQTPKPVGATPIRKCYPSFDKTKVPSGQYQNPTTCWRDYPCNDKTKSVAMCQLTCERAKAAWQKRFGCKSAYTNRMPTVA